MDRKPLNLSAPFAARSVASRQRCPRTESFAEIDDLRKEIRQTAAESRRHTEVLFDSLRDDIRLVAEGLAVFSDKVDRLSRCRPRRFVGRPAEQLLFENVFPDRVQRLNERWLLEGAGPR